MSKLALVLVVVVGCGESAQGRDGAVDPADANVSCEPTVQNDPACHSAKYAEIPDVGSPCPEVGLTCKIAWPTGGDACRQAPMVMESSICCDDGWWIERYGTVTAQSCPTD